LLPKATIWSSGVLDPVLKINPAAKIVRKLTACKKIDTIAIYDHIVGDERSQGNTFRECYSFGKSRIGQISQNLYCLEIIKFTIQ